MRVRVFDEAHEKDLENAINQFLKELNNDIIDIKFNVSTSLFGEEQIYCFSAMVIYEEG